MQKKSHYHYFINGFFICVYIYITLFLVCLQSLIILNYFSQIPQWMNRVKKLKSILTLHRTSAQKLQNVVQNSSLCTLFQPLGRRTLKEKSIYQRLGIMGILMNLHVYVQATLWTNSFQMYKRSTMFSKMICIHILHKHHSTIQLKRVKSKCLTILNNAEKSDQH